MWLNILVKMKKSHTLAPHILCIAINFIEKLIAIHNNL